MAGEVYMLKCMRLTPVIEFQGLEPNTRVITVSFASRRSQTSLQAMGSACNGQPVAAAAAAADLAAAVAVPMHASKAESAENM